MSQRSRSVVAGAETGMEYRFEPMSDAQARAIADWRYDPPYDFYDSVADPADLAELLDPAQRENCYFGVLSASGNLVGFFMFKHEGDTVEVGLGLRPDLTGRGLGLPFLLSGMKFARARYAPARFRLAVAMFNQRAIQVYERAGFRRVESYMHWTNGGEHEFLRMEGMAEDAVALSSLDTATLEPLVRGLLGEPAAVVAGEWSCRPLSGGARDGLGLHRVTGSAHVGAASHPWALVLKVYAAADGADPGAWDYPPREGLAYGSGLLDALPSGLAAPRWFAVETQPDGTGWLWLEAVTDAHPGPWPLARYAWVARRLGRFNGAYLAGLPLPDQPWLSQGFLRSWVEPAGPAVADLERLAGPGGPPVLRQLYPAPVVTGFRQLWDERERFLTALDRLPRTFCHHDAFRRNLLVRRGPEGEELVALDWTQSGHGAVGEELAQLVVASLLYFETAEIAPRDFDAACFTSYVAGLREAGWVGDERLVRLGYTAHAALHNTVGLLHPLLPEVIDPTLHPALEEMLGRPFAEVTAGWAKLWPFQLGLAEEARALLPMVGLPTEVGA